MANSQPAISEPNKPTETQSNYTRKLNIETQKKRLNFECLDSNKMIPKGNSNWCLLTI